MSKAIFAVLAEPVPGAGTSPIVQNVSVGSRPDDYKLGALRYDLSKLRAKGLIEIAKRRLIAPPTLTPIPVSRNLTFEIAACARMRLRERRASC